LADEKRGVPPSFQPAVFRELPRADTVHGWYDMLRQETVSSREVILIVGGALSGSFVEEFHEKMEELCAGRFQKVTLDLSGAPSINSAALGKLLYFRKKLVEQGGSLQIGGCSDGILRILKAIKFDQLLPIRK